MYGARRVRIGIINDMPGIRYTRINDQMDRRNGIKFSGLRSGLKNRISLYDSRSSSDSHDSRLFSSPSFMEISVKILLHDL
jgi:hypothetical protein